jgi:serine O-acetyltransferase
MFDAALQRFVDDVCASRQMYSLPSQAGRVALEFVESALALLFPHFAGSRSCSRRGVSDELATLESELQQFLEGSVGGVAGAITEAFIASLGGIRAALIEDAEATHDADPAAHSVDEVILAYPGFMALCCHRVGHVLHELGVPLLPRLVAEAAHRQTGIDIHPGAHIGRALAIDHGTGIVIGETSVIGDRVRLYQGVTLGALRVERALEGAKRHPTIEDEVVIYANATILGGNTIIGRGSVIGGNVWLTHSVPAGSVVTEVAVVHTRPGPGEPQALDWDI